MTCRLNPKRLSGRVLALGQSNENDFEIKLKAELSEYIGNEQIITFNYSDQEILAKFPSTAKIEINKEMNLYFDLSQISLFDKNSKERI